MSTRAIASTYRAFSCAAYLPTAVVNPKSDLNLSAPVAAETALPELDDDVSSALSSTDAHTRILRVYGLMEAHGLKPWDSECRTLDVGVNTAPRENISADVYDRSIAWQSV